MGLFDFLKKDSVDTPESLYNQAKLISEYLFQFPYIDPSTVDPSLRKDKPLMDIIILGHKTTIGSDGKTCQATLDAAERIRYQAEFKKRIYELLDKCLSLDPDFAPAFFLYPKVAEWNTRASDRPGLISIYEKFLSRVDKVTEGSREYSLIEEDIKCFGSGNYFDRVERHLADFCFDLGNLYLKEYRLEEAIKQFDKAKTFMPLLPHIYCGLSDAHVKNGDYDKALSLWEEAMKHPFDDSDIQAVIKPRYNGVRSVIERAKRLFGITEKILPIIEQNPGILQKELYSKFSIIPKNDISMILRTLDDQCLILRKKKGSTYQLTLEKPISEILEVVKQLHIE